MTRRSVPPAVLAVLACMWQPPSTSSAEVEKPAVKLLSTSSARPLARQAGKLVSAVAKRAGLIAAAAEALEGATTTSPTIIDKPGTVTREGTYIAVKYLIGPIELRKEVKTELGGIEVPGRGLTVKTKTYVVLLALMDIDKIEIQRDGTDFELTLPDWELKVSFVDAGDVRANPDLAAMALAEYEVEYGPLRPKLIYSETPKALRRALYGETLDQARALFYQEQRRAARELARGLEKDLEKRFSGLRFKVRY